MNALLSVFGDYFDDVCPILSYNKLFNKNPFCLSVLIVLVLDMPVPICLFHKHGTGLRNFFHKRFKCSEGLIWIFHSGGVYMEASVAAIRG